MKKCILLSIILALIFGNVFVSRNVRAGTQEAWSRNSAGGGVNIEVEFINPAETDIEVLEFNIFMDTHSGDLTDINFEEKISLKSNEREINIAQLNWEWESKSAHHPSATLTVENKDENKVPFYQLATTQLQLTISDLREVEHEFGWDIERPYLVVVPNEVDGSLSVVDINENEVIDTIEI